MVAWRHARTGRTAHEWSNCFIAASIHDKYLAGPSTRQICTRCCFAMTNMIQVCSNFRSHVHPGETHARAGLNE